MRRQVVAACLLFGIFLTGIAQSRVRAADWPMWRGDAARSGYTDETLPTELAEVWRHQSVHRPQRAWPRSQRQLFDRCYQPVVYAGRLFFGSSVDCKLVCLDAASGEPQWSYFTGGPIRFAPVAWRDRVAVASDDGYLYVLNSASGKLVWKHRAGPGDALRLGNERMISKWPARGGPLLIDDVLYYAGESGPVTEFLSMPWKPRPAESYGRTKIRAVSTCHNRTGEPMPRAGWLLRGIW